MITCTRVIESPEPKQAQATLSPCENKRMPWNWPNTLTWLRICAIPLIALLFYMPYPWRYPAAGLLFAAAGITDSLDGYLARRLGVAFQRQPRFPQCTGDDDANVEDAARRRLHLVFARHLQRRIQVG